MSAVDIIAIINTLGWWAVWLILLCAIAHHFVGWPK